MTPADEDALREARAARDKARAAFDDAQQETAIAVVGWRKAKPIVRPIWIEMLAELADKCIAAEAVLEAAQAEVVRLMRAGGPKEGGG